MDVLPTHPTGDGFPAEIDLWPLKGMAITRTAAPSVNVTRDSVHLRRNPVDHWVISYCPRGAHSAKTADMEVQVPAKVPFLWSLGQEFSHERTHINRVQFVMPRDTFQDIAPLLDAACGTALDTPLGHLLGDYMVALERCLPAVTEADFPHITNAVVAMVAAAVAPSEGRVAARQTANRFRSQGAGKTGYPPASTNTHFGAEKPKPVDYDPFAPQAGNVRAAPSQQPLNVVQTLMQNPEILRALLQRQNGGR